MISTYLPKQERTVLDFLNEVLTGHDQYFFMSKISPKARMSTAKRHFFSKVIKALLDNEIGMSGLVSIAKILSH